MNERGAYNTVFHVVIRLRRRNNAGRRAYEERVSFLRRTVGVFWEGEEKGVRCELFRSRMFIHALCICN